MDRPVRVGALLFLVVLTLLGSAQGAAMLWVRAGWPGGFTVVAPSTHGMVQVGAFFLLILGFLTHVLPGMTGQRGEVKGALVPLWVMAAGLVASTLTELLALGQGAAVGARLVVVAGLLGAALALGRTVAGGKLPVDQPGFPWLLLGVAGFGVCSLVWVMEAAGLLVRPVAAALALPTTVTVVILGMGYRMFTAMLHLGAPRASRFVPGMVAWWLGGVANATVGPTPWADGLMLLGAVLVVWALGFHHRKNALQAGLMRAPTFRVLQVQIVTGAVALVASPAVALLGPWTNNPWAMRDVSRHLLAMGFCLNVAMAITQHVLPRMTAGRMCSPRVMALGAAVLGVGLLLRAVAVVAPGMPQWMAWSGVVSWLAVVVYAVHLGRAIAVPVHLDDARAAG